MLIWLNEIVGLTARPPWFTRLLVYYIIIINMNIGDMVPQLTGTDENGREVNLSDFKGKKLALYFYPKDSTPGCTAEACSLRDSY